jgi:hypothetical protein
MNRCRDSKQAEGLVATLHTRSVHPVASLLLPLLGFQMRNIERAHSLNSHGESSVGRYPLFRVAEPLAGCPQGSKRLCPIEALPLAVVTKWHVDFLADSTRTNVQAL